MGKAFMVEATLWRGGYYSMGGGKGAKQTAEANLSWGGY